MLLTFSPLQYLYMLIYFLVSFCVFSLSDFFSLWFMMELQMICFMALCFEFSYLSVSGFVPYFIIQSVSSLGLLYFYFLMLSTPLLNCFVMLMLFLLKLGVFPFTGWYVSCVGALPKFLVLVVLTIQKLPLLVLMSFSGCFNNSETSFILFIVSSFNIFYCSMSSFFSSTNYLSFMWLSMASTFWIILSMYISLNFFFIYFLVYSATVFLFFVSNSNSPSLCFYISILNMCGFPPTPDFFFKVFMIIYLLLVDSSLLSIPVVFTALFFSVFYMLSFLMMGMKSFTMSFSTLLLGGS